MLQCVENKWERELSRQNGQGRSPLRSQDVTGRDTDSERCGAEPIASAGRQVRLEYCLKKE